MQDTDVTRFVFLSLLNDRGDAEALRVRLAERIAPADGVTAAVYAPPDALRGGAFFRADAQSQQAVAAWWRSVVGERVAGDNGFEVVAITEFDNELVAATPFVDGWIFVVLGEADRDDLFLNENVLEVRGTPLEVADQVIAAYANRPEHPKESRVFSSPEDEPLQLSTHSGLTVVEAGSSDSMNATEPVPTPTSAVPSQPIFSHEASEPTPHAHVQGADSPVSVDPFSLASQREVIGNIDHAPRGDQPIAAEQPAARVASKGSGRPSILQRIRDPLAGLLKRGAPSVDLTEYANYLVDPAYRGLIVVVGNPKGGVGKTNTAVGIGLTFSDMLEQSNVNGRVVVVDGNPNNSDLSQLIASARLKPPTVRRLTDHLRSTPHDLPDVMYADSLGKNMVILPEEHGAKYQLQEIEDLARYLRQGYTAIVVDLVNKLPGTRDADERLVQWWLEQANVAVVPVQGNPDDWEGARAFLDVLQNSRGPLPAIVAYAEPPQKQLREHEVLQNWKSYIADHQQVRAIYSVPEDWRVPLAALDGTNITDSTPKVRAALADLTVGVLATHVEDVYARSSGGSAIAEPSRENPINWSR